LQGSGDVFHWQRELFKTILDQQNLGFDRDGRPHLNPFFFGSCARFRVAS
jgi:hypothetical protein